MRFKPMPRYVRGAVVHSEPGGKIKPSSPVGRLFIQPFVTTADGRTVRFDDAIGPWFALVSWAVDPRRYMDEPARRFWERMGARFVAVMPTTQVQQAARQDIRDLLVLGDTNQDLKEWFGRHQTASVILRPDRFVAATGTTQGISQATRDFMAAIGAMTGPDAKFGHPSRETAAA
jgi:3-(3-hydroxy-phenyl)propionate hydroxylase